MYIRPYTISQIALVLLIAFLLIYLRQSIQRRPALEDRATPWMMQAAAWGGLNILISLTMGITDQWPFTLLRYARVICGLLLFYAFARAFYALPPTESFGLPQEDRYASRLILLLIGAEVVYTCLRFWRFGQTGVMSQRPLVGEIPLLLVMVWDFLLLLRKLWAAEKAVELPLGRRLRRVLLTPQSDVGLLYRWFLLIVAGLLGMVYLFVRFQHGTIPVWVMVWTDLLVIASIVTTAFVYLRYRFVSITLEMRVVGAGLVIFLGLASVLGWLITLAFFRDQATVTNIQSVIGSQLNTNWTPSAPEREMAIRLSHILLPLVWFEVIGSLVFLFFFIFYYRRTVTATVRQIVDGFAQIEGGYLNFRIAALPWDDEFSQIVRSFNRMAQALESSAQEVRDYQTHLQELVEQRTAELRREIEVRKELELHQGIQEERARIARESHDGLLQTLLGVRIRLNRGKRLSQQEASQIEAELHELAGEITQAAQDLRNLINDLNADILRDGLLLALRRVIERQQANYAIPIHAQLTYEAGLLTPSQELNLLRIVQEALTNLCRHSHASQAGVLLRAVPQSDSGLSLSLEVRDNGNGFDPLSPRGLGWGVKNMQRRAEQLGATFHIHSQPGEGTVVRLTLQKGASDE